MLNNDELNDINKRINKIKKSLKNTDGNNIPATKREFINLCFSGFILSLFFLLFSFVFASIAFENEILMQTPEIAPYAKLEYFSGMFLSFALFFGSLYSLIFFSNNSKKAYDETYCSTSDFFVKIIASAALYFIFGFGTSFFWIFSFSAILSFFDFSWRFNQQLFGYILVLPFYIHYIKQELSLCFKNSLEQNKFISDIKDKNFDLKNKHDESLLEVKSLLLNSINTIDDYKLLKLICNDMKCNNIKSYYSDIENKLIKDTEFKDFKSLEMSILMERTNVNTIQNI